MEHWVWITHCLPVALNNTYSWAEDVSQAPATITVHLLIFMAQQTMYYM